MADHPIIFSAPMVRALLDGRKTQTRRLIRNMPPAPDAENVVHPPKHPAPYFDAYCGGKRTESNPRGMTDHWCWWTRDDRASAGCRIGYVPGDRLYVREACAIDGERVWYRLGHEEARAKGPRVDVRWRPSIHMPRRASRLTLPVAEVRVQRLQDITEADAIAEGGVEVPVGAPPGIPDLTGWHHGQQLDPPEDCFLTARFSFRHLWNGLHAEPGTRWEDNPWIYALTFRVARGNIDNLETDRG